MKNFTCYNIKKIVIKLRKIYKETGNIIFNLIIRRSVTLKSVLLDLKTKLIFDEDKRNGSH